MDTGEKEADNTGNCSNRRHGVAWMTDRSDDIVTDIDWELELFVDSFDLSATRYLNPTTGQVISSQRMILQVSGPGYTPIPPSAPDIREVQVHFTDLPHPNVGEINADDNHTLDIYVSIVETQTWWQILSNGPALLIVDIKNAVGATYVVLASRQAYGSQTPAEQAAAVRQRRARPAKAPV
jgi:hypothetical protein